MQNGGPLPRFSGCTKLSSILYYSIEKIACGISRQDKFVIENKWKQMKKLFFYKRCNLRIAKM